MKYINLFETQAAYDAAEKYYPNVSYIEATDEVVYQENNPTHDYSKDYLTFEALESGTFTLTVPNSVRLKMTSVSYSTDDGATWIDTTISSAQTITTPTIAQGNKVIWKGVGMQTSYQYDSQSNSSVFSSTGNFNASGNIMSLLYGDNFQNQTTFQDNSNSNFSYLFYGATTLISAENMILPATTLKAYSYAWMFGGCTSLTTAPTLYATTMNIKSCERMFSVCTSLTTAPVLSATTLSNDCYSRMFFRCTSLETAPTLPATTLAPQCYSYMFQYCTNLNSITMLATNISASGCTSYWVEGVAATGTFTKAAEMTTLETGYSGIPSGWTVVDA